MRTPFCLGPFAAMTVCSTSATARAEALEHRPAPSSQPDLAGRHARDRDAGELALEPPRHRRRGHDGRAVALERQGRHQPDTIDLGHRLQYDPGAVGFGLQVVTEGGAVRGQHERVAGEFGEGHLVAVGQRAVARREEHQLLLEQDGGLDLRIVDREVDHGQVDPSRDELGDQRGGVGLEDDHLHPGVGGAAPPSGAAAPASGRSSRSRRRAPPPRPRHPSSGHRRSDPRARAGPAGPGPRRRLPPA